MKTDLPERRLKLFKILLNEIKSTLAFARSGSETPDAKKTTLLSNCRTRWIEQHEAYNVFLTHFAWEFFVSDPPQNVKSITKMAIKISG